MKDKTLVVRMNVRNLIHAENRSVAEEFFGALQAEVYKLVHNALRRANENGRRTVMARDL